MLSLVMNALPRLVAVGVAVSPVSGSSVPLEGVHLDKQGVSSRDAISQTQLFNLSGLEGLSAKCVDAMQTPVSCYPDGIELLLSSQGQAGINAASPVKLTADDLADLCTASCAESLASLSTSVNSACRDAVVAPPQSNSTAYLPGTDAQENIFGGDNATAFGPRLAVDLALVGYKLGCMKDAAVADAQAAWCRLRMAQNLTHDCDDCELGAYRVRMQDSPGGYDAELAAQYTARVSSCSRSLTPLATPTTTGGGYVSSPTPTTNGTRPCAGSMVPVSTDTQCDDFARANSIGTEQLLQINGLTSGCVGFPGGRTALCVQGACKTYTVQVNDTCSSVIKAAGITAVQLLSWNPMLGTRGCNADLKRQVGHVVCVGNPLPYVTPSGGNGSTVPSTTSSVTGPTSAFDQFENLTSIWTHDPLPTDAPTNTATGATPWKTPTYDLAPGSISGCYYMYDNQLANLSCMAVAARYGVDEATWVKWNPSVERAGDDNNQTRKDDNSTWLPAQGSSDCYLDAGTRYCGLFWDPSLASPKNDTKSPYAPRPGDATKGATDKCYAWDKTPDEAMNNLCEAFLDSEGITIAQLYAWNPAVGDKCQNIWLDTSYCVSADDPSTNTTTTTTTTATRTSTSTPPTTTTGVKPPGPTQSGIPANCNKYAVTKDGDGCEGFAKRNGVTLEQLYKWNPVLNNKCENFWDKEAYCIGVPS